MKRSRKRSNVWVIIHCEWMQFGRDPTIDEMVFHVVSSRRIAERYMASTWAATYSWWKLERHRVDDVVEDVHQTHYYNHKGKPVDLPAYSRALSYFKKRRPLVPR